MLDKRLRLALTWIVAAAILALLVREIRPDALREALRHGAWAALSLYIVFENALALGADAYATRQAFAVAGVRRRWSEVFLARGSSYLLGLLSYFAGQGGMGFYLARSGAAVGRSAGAVMLMMATNGIAIAVLAAAGLLAELGAGVLDVPRELLWLGIAGVPAAIAVYLAVIAARPGWLARYGALAPLFEAGVGGHVRATVARLPHMALLTVLHWVAFLVWGIPVPALHGLALNPIVFLISALPVTPGGLGTTQAAQVLFFSPWSIATTADGRAADVLAYSLVHHVVGLGVQCLLGLACLMVLRRRIAREEE